MKCIEITVSPTGQTSVQTKGFVGSECRDASRFFEETLWQQSFSFRFNVRRARSSVSTQPISDAMRVEHGLAEAAD